MQIIAQFNAGAPRILAMARPRPDLPAALVEGLGDAEVALLEELRPVRRRVSNGQVLYQQGDCIDQVFVLADGWAFRYRTLGDGRRQIVDFTLPGALLGFGADCTMTHGVEALTVCDLYAIPRARFERMLVQVPRFAMRIVGLLARAESLALERLATLGRQDARERVAHLLIELIARLRDAGKRFGGNSIVLPLTQTHIADAVGLTAVHVCRTLASLRRDGICVLRNGRLQIPEMRRLIAVAGYGAGDPMPWRCTAAALAASVPAMACAG